MNLVEILKTIAQRLPDIERERKRQMPYQIFPVSQDVLSMLKKRKEYREYDGRMLYDIPHTMTVELILSTGLGSL